MMTRKIFSLSTIFDERNASIKKSKLLLYEILNEFSLHNDTTSAKCVINNFITTPVDILSVSLMWHYFWLKRHVVTVPICRGGVNSFPDIYHYPFYFIGSTFIRVWPESDVNLTNQLLQLDSPPIVRYGRVIHKIYYINSTNNKAPYLQKS